MGALVRTQIDAVLCAGDSGEQRFDERHVVADEREHRSIVVDVRVHVQQARPAVERAADRIDDAGISSIGDVRHRLEGQRHGAYSTNVKTYYDRRAPEYDDWWLGEGLYADRNRPGWHDELRLLEEEIATLPPVRTLDVACGTGFLTRHLRGDVVGLDQSETMLRIAAGRMPAARLVRGEAVPLPFPDGDFDRVFTSHFYGHVLAEEREPFLREARRVGTELVVVDSACREGVPAEEWQERILDDGSAHRVYKRFFTGAGLAAELGGGRVLHDGTWFVVVA